MRSDGQGYGSPAGEEIADMVAEFELFPKKWHTAAKTGVLLNTRSGGNMILNKIAHIM